MADIRSKQEYPESSETTAYWEEHVWENVLSFNKEFWQAFCECSCRNLNNGAEIYTRNYVGVIGKTITYKVEDGQLVTGEQPGRLP